MTSNSLGIYKTTPLLLGISLVLLIHFAESAAPRTSFQIPQCSAPKERIRRGLSLDQPHVRKKRSVQITKGSSFECKWALNMPFETERRYSAKLQMAIPIAVNIPSILLEEYGLEKLKGFYVDEEEEKKMKEMEEKEKAEKKKKEEKEKAEKSKKQRNDYEPVEYIETNNYEPIQYDTNDYLPPGYGYQPSWYEDGTRIYGEPTTHFIHRRSPAYSNYTKAVQAERVYFYRHIEGMLNKLGLPASDCMLRTVCEVAHDPVEYGLYGDMFNLLLTPSLAFSTSEEGEGYLEELSEYVRAEKVGHLTGRCYEEYEACPVSLFDLIPLVANTLYGSWSV